MYVAKNKIKPNLHQALYKVKLCNQNQNIQECNFVELNPG